MRRRPPHLHLRHKHRESPLNGHVNPNALSNDRLFHCLCHVSPPSQNLFFFSWNLRAPLILQAPSQPLETRPPPSPRADRSAPAAGRHPQDPAGTSAASPPGYPSPNPHPSAPPGAATPPDGSLAVLPPI